MRKAAQYISILTLLALLVVFFIPDLIRGTRIVDFHDVEITYLTLSPEKFPVRPESGKALYLDISTLNLSELADDSPNSRNTSPVLLLEDGKQLTPHALHDEIRTGQSGKFSHWSNAIYFSSLSPEKVGTLTLVYPTLPSGSDALSKSNRERALTFLLVLSMFGAFFAYRSGNPGSKELRIAALAIVAIIYVSELRFGRIDTDWGPSAWNTFVFTPDSFSWMSPFDPETSRPPLYQAFARGVAKLSGEAFNYREFKQLPVNEVISRDHVLLSVARAQKIFMVFSALVCAWLLSALIYAPLVAAVFSIFLSVTYFPFELDHIMAETLAQAWMLLIIPAFVFAVLRPSIGKLALLTVLCGLLYQTRSSGIFSFLLLPIAWLALSFDQSRINSIKAAGIALGILLCTYAAPGIYLYLSSGFYSSAPMLPDAEIAFALEFGTPSDAQFIEDEVARNYYLKTLEKKKTVDSELWPNGTPYRALYGSTNVYKVAHPLSDSLGHTKNERRRIWSLIGKPILFHHKWEYLAMIGESFRIATNTTSRLSKAPFPGTWWMTALFLVSALIIRNRLAVCALAFLGCHFASLGVLSIFDLPNPRPVYATEILVLTGALLLSHGLLEKCAQLRRRSKKGRREAETESFNSALRAANSR
jgi:hypothetical protein